MVSDGLYSFIRTSCDIHASQGIDIQHFTFTNLVSRTTILALFPFLLRSNPTIGFYTPLFKSNRNLLSGVKLWYLCSMYRFEIFHAGRWGLLHSLWKISWVYVIAARLCEHSNLVMFEKRAAKTLQHGYRYGDILMLYDIITTYEWFFCYNWHKLCSSNKLLDFSSIYNFLVKYAI